MCIDSAIDINVLISVLFFPVLDQTPAQVYSIDRDPAACQLAETLPACLAEALDGQRSEEELRERFHFVHGRFGNVVKLLKAKGLQ